MFYDCHVHSTFSSDSTLTIDEAVQEAIEKKLKGIAFTDHLDLDFPGYESDFHVEPAEYFKDVLLAKEKYKASIDILTGIEIGIQPHVINDTIKILENQHYDFVLGSIHIVNKKDPYDLVFYKNKTMTQAYLEYLDEISMNVKLYPNFDILGHFDYITRYSPYPTPSMLYEDYMDAFDEIFKYLIMSGKGIEINTATYCKRNSNERTSTELDCQIIKRYRELGGEIITLGSDAHSTNIIGNNFSLYSQIIKDCGFKYLTHFKDRNPIFTKI